MKKNKNYIIKWHRNPHFITVTHMLSFMFILVMTILIFQEEQKTPGNVKIVLLILIIALMSINVILFIVFILVGTEQFILMKKRFGKK